MHLELRIKCKMFFCQPLVVSSLDPVLELQEETHEYSSITSQFVNSFLKPAEFQVVSAKRISNDGVADRYGKWFQDILAKV